MVSPELDWWIKNVCQVNKPVYNRKRYAISVGKSTSLTIAPNQDENILLILCTDYLISSFGVTAGQLVTVTDNTKTNENTIITYYPSVVNNVYNPNLNYLIESERLNFGISFASGDVALTIGYITISKDT